MEGVNDLSTEKRLIFEQLPKTISIRKEKLKREAELRRCIESIRRTPTTKGEIDAVKIFPEEIWAMILEYVNEAEDIKNARDTCLLFRRLLEERYQVLLLVDVLSLPTFQNYVWPKQVPTIVEDLNGRLVDLPQSNPRVKMWKLRAVCKRWKKAVDLYFERGINKLGWEEINPLAYKFTPLFFSIPDSQELVFKPSSTYLQMTDNITNIFSSSGDPAGRSSSPLKFFSHCVEISLSLDTIFELQELKTFCFTKLPSLIAALGNQIFHFRLDLDTYSIHELGLTLSQAYLLLRELIESMPRLVWLKVIFSYFERFYSFPQEELDQLATTIGETPFPKLESLQKLTLSSNVPAAPAETLIINAILESNTHIHDLELWIGSHDGFTFYTPALPSINGVDKLDSLAFRTVGIYPDLMRTSWPLKRVRIEGTSHYDPIDVSDLFRLLEDFAGTLTWVELSLQEVSRSNPGFLRLPNVTYFSYAFRCVSTTHEENKEERERDSALAALFSIDFIYFMDQLEFLSWTGPNCKAIGQDERDKIIEFKSGKMNLLDSNIWNVLPSLKTIVVETGKVEKVFKRAERRRMNTHLV